MIPSLSGRAAAELARRPGALAAIAAAEAQIARSGLSVSTSPFAATQPYRAPVRCVARPVSPKLVAQNRANLERFVARHLACAADMFTDADADAHLEGTAARLHDWLFQIGEPGMPRWLRGLDAEDLAGARDRLMAARSTAHFDAAGRLAPEAGREAA